MSANGDEVFGEVKQSENGHQVDESDVESVLDGDSDKRGLISSTHAKSDSSDSFNRIRGDSGGNTVEVEMPSASVSGTLQDAAGPVPSSAPYTLTKRTGLAKFNNKGDISNFITFLIMCAAIVTKIVGSDAVRESDALAYVLAFGLFGFAGGITNWLAVKMLFDKIPGLVGSGVIPRQFKAIRETVKDTIMRTFFDPAYLDTYLNERARGFMASADLGGRLTAALERPDLDERAIKMMTEMAAKPEGMMINTFAQMFGGVPLMWPHLKPLLKNFGLEMVKMLTEKFNVTEVISVDKVRTEIDRLMTEKLLQLTPEKVKELMEDVIREHLGWLIVWGNVFGGLIGVVSLAVGYGA